MALAAPMAVAPPLPAGAAPPTCVPGAAPQVVGSARDRLVVTVPQCASGAGLTGYRVVAETSPGGVSTGSVDVGAGIVQAEVGGLTAGTAYRFRVAARNVDGPGPLTAASAPSSPPFVSMAALVDRQFADFAGRAPTSAERSDWVARLGDGRMTPIGAVDEAQLGTYWQVQSPAIRLYQAYFLRRPDLAGLRYWADQLRGGRSLQSVSSAFAASPEFRTLYGSLTNRQFVELIYENILGRPGEPAGVTYWTGELDARRRNRGQVMVGFSESPEYRSATAGQVATVNLFTGMLQRVPTAAEVATWAPQSGTSRAALIAFLLGADAYEARVAVVAPPAVTTETLPNGTQGTAYASTTLTAAFGQAPLSWSVSAGSLPTGLALSAGGVLSGTPTGSGPSTFTVRVADARGQATTKAFTVSVTAVAGPTITTASLPGGQVGSAYAATLTATGGVGSRTWSVSTGSLPAGVTLTSGTGVVSGTPTSVGTATFTVQVTDGLGRSSTKQLSIAVTQFGITTTAVPGGTQGIAYATSLTAVGGGPYTWSVSTGALPAGLTLGASTGLISGTPTGTATSTFTARVTAPGGKEATRTYTLAVVASADWPQAGHDGEGRGWNPGDTTITPANVAGLAEQYTLPVSSEPVIAGNQLYRFSALPDDPSTYGLHAVDLATGVLDWSIPIGGSCGGGPVVVSATAVVISCGWTRAYRRAAPHDLLWDTADTDPGSYVSSMRLAGTTLLGYSGGAVTAYRMSDGARLWAQPQPSGGGTIYDIVESGGTVVVAYSDRLRGLDAATGAQRWNLTGVTSTSIAAGGGWVYTNNGRGASRYALADGASGWSVLAGQDIYDLLGLDGDTLYVWEAAYDFGPPSPSRVRALRVSDGGQRWQADVPERIRSFAVTGSLVWVASTSIYSQGRDSDLIAYDRATGAQRHAVDFADNMYGGAAFGNGHVAVAQGGSSGGTDPHKTRVFSLAPPPPAITTRVLPQGRIGTAYSQTLAATGGQGPYTWAVTSGTLPTGITLAANGTLTGTPTGATGLARFTVRATDARGRSSNRTLNLETVVTGTSTWPALGRDEGRTATNTAETVIGVATAAQLAFRWRTAPATIAGPQADPSRQPVVVGSRVYDVVADGTLRAWSTTGTTANRAALWTVSADSPSSHPFVGQVTESGGTIYATDYVGALYAIRASDGQRLWKVDTPTTNAATLQSAPLVVGSRVLVMDNRGDVRAYATATGAVAWGGTTVDLPDGFQSAALVTDGTRAYAWVDCTAFAITLATGAVAWDTDVTSDNCSALGGRLAPPILAHGRLLVHAFVGSAALDAATGDILWETRDGPSRGLVTSVVTNGLWIFSAERYSGTEMVAHDVFSGALVWSNDTDDLSYAGFSSAGGLLVARTYDQLAGYSALTGEKVWDGGQPDSRGYTTGPPAIAEGKLWFSTYDDGVKAYGPP